MDNFTRTILGIKDPRLELDTNREGEIDEEQEDQITIHLIQSYPMHCPVCGCLMSKNGYKEVNYLGPSLL